MTVLNSTRKVRANGDGVVIGFQFSFPVKQATDIVVKKIVNSTAVATTQVVGTDYTIALNSVTEGGTITYTIAPTALEDSFIIRETAQDQQTALPIGGNFPEISVENEIDRSRLIDIELQEQVSRCIIFPDIETLANITAPIGSSASDRATKLWGWDSDGTGLDLYTTIGTTQIELISAEGDIIQGGTAAVPERLAIGSDMQIPYVNSTKLGYKDQDFYSVKDFGAVGDGIANDTTAINLAITTANAAGGGVVWIPEGVYSVSTITMKANITLRGVGSKSLFQLGDAIDATVLSLTNINNVIMEDIGIDGNSAGQTAGISTAFNGIRVIGTCTRIAIRNVDITDCHSSAIFVDKSGAFTPSIINISDNYIHQSGAQTDQTSRGIWVRESTDIIISRNQVVGEDGFAITVQNSSLAVISSNVVRDSVKYDGIMVYNSDRVIVANNIVSNCLDTGIVVELSDYFTVTGNNVFSSGKDGIIITGSSYGSVSSNIVLNSSQVADNDRYGIVVQSSGGTISVKNTIHGNMVRDVAFKKAKSSIAIEDASQTGHVIRGNRVDGAVTSDYKYQSDTDHDFGGITRKDVTLGAAVTTFNVECGYSIVTADAGGNTIATITGGREGMILNLIFVDTLITITDTSTGTPDSINTASGGFTSAGNKALTLVHSGNKWHEISRSVN